MLKILFQQKYDFAEIVKEPSFQLTMKARDILMHDVMLTRSPEKIRITNIPRLMYFLILKCYTGEDKEYLWRRFNAAKNKTNFLATFL